MLRSARNSSVAGAAAADRYKGSNTPMIQNNAYGSSTRNVTPLRTQRDVTLPKIGAASANNTTAVKLLTEKMMGRRTDENCNLNRTALMMEKANRLGENFKLKLDSSRD